MCYDISFTSTIQLLDEYFPNLVPDHQLDLALDSLIHVMGNFVYPDYPIIYQSKDDDKPHLRQMSWGVIEYYAPAALETLTKKLGDPQKAIKQFYDDLKKKRNNYLNARSERILDDPKSYWHKIRNRRCLIPVNAIYEHREVVGWKNKVPYKVWPKAQPVFFLPGLYSVAKLPDPKTGEIAEVWTFTLITRAANEGMRMIHNHGPNKHRMPLFLPLEVSKRWIDPSLADDEYHQILATELPFTDLDTCTVYTIRSPKLRPDGLSKNAPFVWEGLPPLGQGDPVDDQS
jgi:putative SOS response-associated peptidase YedK